MEGARRGAVQAGGAASDRNGNPASGDLPVGHVRRSQHRDLPVEEHTRCVLLYLPHNCTLKLTPSTPNTLVLPWHTLGVQKQLEGLE